MSVEQLYLVEALQWQMEMSALSHTVAIATCGCWTLEL